MNDNLTYLSLGSNLGDKETTFANAINLIKERVGEVIKISSFYKTDPLNPKDIKEQPQFLNAVLSCQSKLSPERILAKILEIELELGRDREDGKRWGPRVIDIDIIAIGQLVIKKPNLEVPHPGMQNRDFVLIPLKEIEETFFHPKLNLSINDLVTNLNSSDSKLFIIPKN